MLLMIFNTLYPVSSLVLVLLKGVAMQKPAYLSPKGSRKSFFVILPILVLTFAFLLFWSDTSGYGLIEGTHASTKHEPQFSNRPNRQSPKKTINSDYTSSVVAAAAGCLSPNSLPNGSENSPYSATVSSLMGTPPYTYFIGTGNLPPGLSLDSNTGEISGTPTTAGTYTFNITVSDLNNTSCGQAFSIGIIPSVISLPPSNNCSVVISPSTLNDGLVGSPYSQTIIATDANDDTFFYVVSAGVLPDGLSLDINTGEISGTPIKPATFSFDITVTNQIPINTNSCVGKQSYTINITNLCPVIFLAPSTLPDAMIGVSYNQTFTAQSALPVIKSAEKRTPIKSRLSVNKNKKPLSNATNAGAYTFSIFMGTFPPGLSLDVDGNITGTPTVSGTFDFIVQAIEVSSGCTTEQKYSINVAGCPSLTISPSTLPNGVRGQAYSQQLTTKSNTNNPIFSISGGQLPAGLSLSRSGLISGAPVVNGGFAFTVVVTDNAGCTGSQDYKLIIDCTGIKLSGNLTNGTVGTPYNRTLSASGGTTPYKFSVIAGSLPPGLTLDVSGNITGTPTAPGTSTFTVMAEDSSGLSSCIGTGDFNITVNCDIKYSPDTLPSGQLGVAYNQTVTLNGLSQNGFISLAASNVPPGLTFTSKGNTFNVAGTPSIAGSYTFTVQANDNSGCGSAKDFTILVIANCPTITVTPSTLPNATVGTVYAQTLTATGGTPAYTFSLGSLPLPAGLTLTSSGSIEGTPTTPGTTTFDINVSDSNRCASLQTYTYTIVVNPPPCPTITITPLTLPNGMVGTAYTQALTVTGGVPAYTFSLAQPLPAGLTFSNGSIGGIPTTAGTTTFDVGVTDSNGCTGSATITITIDPAPNTNGVISFALDNFTANEGESATITINRSGGAKGSVSVVFNTIDGSAIGGQDYTSTSKTVTFADGDTSPKIVTVPTLDDTTAEPVETIGVSLTSVTGGATLGLSIARISINDNDALTPKPARVQISAGSYTAIENDGGLVITVTRSGDLNTTVTANYSTLSGTANPGSDFADIAGTLTFNPGVSSQSFTIPIIDDTEIENTEAFSVTLNGLSSNAILSGVSTAQITIIDNDQPAPPGVLKLETQTDFGQVNIGSIAKQVAKIINTGGSNFTISPSVVAGDGFSISAPFSKDTLAPGESATTEISFFARPGRLGISTGTLVVATSVGSSTLSLRASSIDLIAPVVKIGRPTGGQLLMAGQPSTIDFQGTDNDGIASYVVSFINSDSSSTNGTSKMDIARVAGDATSVIWNVPANIETGQGRIMITALDRNGNSVSAMTGLFSIQRADIGSPVLRTAVTFTPPPADVVAPPANLVSDAQEVRNADDIPSTPSAVLSVKVSFDPPPADQILPPQNLTVRANEVTGLAQIGRSSNLTANVNNVGATDILGYNIYRVPQPEDGPPPPEVIVKPENLVATLDAGTTTFSDTVSTSSSTNYSYSVTAFFGNGMMSMGSNPASTNLPVIKNPVFTKGTIFIDAAGSFVQDGAVMIINDVDSYKIQFDDSGTRLTIPKKFKSLENKLTIKKVITKDLPVKLLIKNPDGNISVAVLFLRGKGVVASSFANSVKLSPTAVTPGLSGYNIYRVSEPEPGQARPTPEQIAQPENLVGSIAADNNMFIDFSRNQDSETKNFLYAVTSFFISGDESKGSQSSGTDLPVLNNFQFGDRTIFIDNSKFIKDGAMLVINDTDMFPLIVDTLSGTRLTIAKGTLGSKSGKTIDQVIIKGSSVRLTVKNSDGRESTGVIFTR